MKKIKTTPFYYLIISLSFISIIKNLHAQTKPDNISKIDLLMKLSYERDIFNGNILVAKGDSIIYQKSFGYTDGSKQKELNQYSIFKIGSIAKEFNAVAIMMLKEQGILSLDNAISRFDLDLPSWAEKVKIRNLLNYTGGLPEVDARYIHSDKETWGNLRKLSSTLFEPGTDFHYNSSSVFLQRRIIESITGKSFEDFVMENIVVPLKMTNSVFDPTYNYSNRVRCFDFEYKNKSDNSTNTGWLWVDINDMYRWVNALNTNQLITEESLRILLTNPYFIDKTSSLGIYDAFSQIQVHHGASFDFESILINDFKNDLVIILLSNFKNRVWNLGHQVHEIMLGKPFTIPERSIAQKLRAESFRDVDNAIKIYLKLKKEDSNYYNFDNPQELNGLGYALLNLNKNQSAIKIFKLATTEFPREANLFDSLGEAYFTDKQYDLSIENYKKAIQLGGTNGNAKIMIKKIRLIQKNK